MSQEINKRIKEEQFSQTQLRRNIRIFQITGFDITVLIVPVIVLIWLEAGLDFHEMLLLQGIFILPILVLEIPSGSIADSIWNRKGCTGIYHLLFSLSMFLYAIGDEFFSFALAELLAGMGIAFETGSDTALVYDSLQSLEHDVDEKFGKIVSKRMTIMFLGGALGALAGGFIGSLSIIQMPIYITAIGQLILATLVFWGYTEPPRMKAETPRVAITKALTSLYHQTELKAILIFSLTGFVFSRIGFWAIQHLLVEDFLFSSIQMGFVIAGFNICAAVCSLAIKSRVTTLSNFLTFLGIFIVEGTYFFVILQVPDLFGILMVSLLTQVTRGIRTPLIQGLLQRFLNSDERATFASLMGLVGSSIYFGFSLITNLNNLSREQTLTLSFIGIMMITILFIGLILKKYWKVLTPSITNIIHTFRTAISESSR